MRSAVEIRDYHLEYLNGALLRLSMYGDELAARCFLSHVAFVDEREDELNSHFDALDERGATTSLGVAGAFERCTGRKATDVEVASVYAEIAFRMGYLETNRILRTSEFDSLRKDLSDICQSRDFDADEVLSTFGAPSWTSKASRPWPNVYLYLASELEDGAIAFDFWNAPDHGQGAGTVKGKLRDIPVLRNVRIRGPVFAREFTFTPIWRTVTGRK